MSTMKRNTVLTAAVAMALAGGVAYAAPQNLSQGSGFTIDNIGINSGNGLISTFSASTAATAASSDNPYAGGSVSSLVGSDAANGFVMNQVTDANGNKYIRTMVFQDTTSGESANFAYEADVSSFRNVDAINAGGSTSNGNGGNNGGIASKMIIDEAAESFAMNATIQNGGFTGNADAAAVDYGKTNVVVNQELGAGTGQSTNDGQQLFAMDIQTDGVSNWTDGSLTILQKGDGGLMADFGHSVLAGTYLAAADLGTLTINHSGVDGGPADTLNTASYGAVTSTWLASNTASVAGGNYSNFSVAPDPATTSAGFGLLVYRGYANAGSATGTLGTGADSLNPVFTQNLPAAEISGFTLSADGGLFDGSVTTQADLNTAFNTAVAPATGNVASQFTAVDGTFNTSPF